MDEKNIFYICPVCFQVCDSLQECHAHKMLECSGGEPGDPRRLPIRDRFGNLVSRAPRWYLEAVRAIPCWTPMATKDQR